MNWKSIFAISSVCVYLILSAFLVYYYRIDILCGYDHPCLKFCSTDTTKHSDKELFESLLEDNITRWYENKFEDVSIYRGLPECTGNAITINEYEEKNPIDYSRGRFYFNDKYRIYENGELSGKGRSFELNNYCMHKRVDVIDEIDNPLRQWVPIVCSEHDLTQKSILIIMSVLSIIILLLTLSVYLYYPDLRDFNGKMIALFLISMICTYTNIPGIYQINRETSNLIRLLRAFGFSSGNLWLNSMILNIYFRLRDFKTSKSEESKFKSYATYVLVFTSFVMLFTLWDLRYSYYRSSSGQFISLVQKYLIFNDLVVLILTLFSIRKSSKQVDFSERPQLEKEKKIFWIYVKLFSIMSVTWSIQLFVTNSELNHFGCLFANLIMLFSAVNVAGLFLGRKKVRELLSQKYYATTGENI